MAAPSASRISWQPSSDASLALFVVCGRGAKNAIGAIIQADQVPIGEAFMPAFRHDGAVINYTATMEDRGRSTLVFVNSLGTDNRIWSRVVDRIAPEYNIIRHDKRGHGLSTLGNAPHRIETYASDLAALLDHLKVKQAVAVGLSVGGLIVQSLYHARPDLVAKLVISNSACKIGSIDSWNQRIEAVRSDGLESIADGVMEMWFSEHYRKEQADDVMLCRTMLSRCDQAGYIACCEALRDADSTREAARISVPTLFIAGEEDGSTPVSLVESSAKLVRGSQFEVLRGTAHIPCFENPRGWIDAANSFLIA
jgi:3-oxoadipate enol-lactonase